MELLPYWDGMTMTTVLERKLFLTLKLIFICCLRSESMLILRVNPIPLKKNRYGITPPEEDIEYDGLLVFSLNIFLNLS